MNKFGDTTLHLSSQQGKVDILRLLTSSGCIMNSANKGGLTSLHMHMAFKEGQLKSVRILILQGCNTIAFTNVSFIDRRSCHLDITWI